MIPRQNTGILGALAAALLLHGLVLLVPLTRPASPVADGADSIELELVAYLQEPARVAETIPGQAPLPAPLAQEINTLQVTEPNPAANTDIILSRQFITETSEAERLFGKPLVIEDPAVQQGFRFPAGPDMLAMLDKPMPDLPFEYTPGLVRFAYDPGVRGDLQRFWDVITPEFGWRTDNGTEFRCILLLVVVGCGWK